MKDLPLDKLGWIAGILDGEGCISLCHFTGRDSYFIPQVTVTNTSEFMIDTFANLVGLGKVNTYKSKNPNHSKIWRWSLRDAVGICEFLIQIFPYLVAKRRRAALMVRFCFERAEGNKDLEHFYTKMKCLNKNGEGNLY